MGHVSGVELWLREVSKPDPIVTGYRPQIDSR